MNFNISIDSFNLVSDVGLPPDGEWCFLVFEGYDKTLNWFIGGYDEGQKLFRVDMGYGGASTKAENVIAWKSFDDVGFYNKIDVPHT